MRAPFNSNVMHINEHGQRNSRVDTVLAVKPKERYSSPVGWVERSETQQIIDEWMSDFKRSKRPRCV